MSEESPESPSPEPADVADVPSQTVGDTPDAASPAIDPLPPVTPPSAGFIVQLFLVPAVIVMAIVGVWAMFGRIAATQQEWSELVTELRSNNKHRRDRAMLGLAQMIEADRALGDEGRNLAGNREVAIALATVFEERLAGKAEVDEVRTPEGGKPAKRTEETRERERLKSQSMTARSLGLLDTVDVVAPALLKGLDPKHDDEVRKDSITAIFVIANRAAEEKADSRLDELLESPGLIDELVAVTEEPNGLLRDTATYALGLLPTATSRERLEVLAEHTSRETRINAAIGLARQKSTAGLPVFETVLADAANPADPVKVPGDTPQSNLLLITLLAATFTSLILAAANKGAVRYAATILSVLLLVGAGAASAARAPEGEGDDGQPRLTAEELRERQLDHVLGLHAVQNSLKATVELADEFSPAERDRLVALVEPLAESHPEARIRLDARTTLEALRSSQ